MKGYRDKYVEMYFNLVSIHLELIKKLIFAI